MSRSSRPIWVPEKIAAKIAGAEPFARRFSAFRANSAAKTLFRTDKVLAIRPIKVYNVEVHFVRKSHYPFERKVLMRTRFWKLLALALALTMALTGCSLIEIDQEMDMAEVVAEVGGVKITKGEVLDVYNYQVEYMNYMYSYYGMGEMSASDREELKDDVLEYYIEAELIRQKADEMGLSNLSEEEYAEADKEAEEYFEEMITEHSAHVDTEGMTDEEARAAVIAHMEAEGTTLEIVKETYRETHEAELVREQVIADVAVTEEEVQAAFDEQVAADEQSYSASAYLYELYNTYEDHIITWNPEGYRTVKHILFKLTDEQSAALNELNSSLNEVEEALAALESGEEAAATDAEATDEAEPAKTADELNAEKAELEQQIADKKAEVLASFKEKTDDVYARLEAGEKFDDLMDELGEDPGMQSEPSKTKGYFVCETSSTWDANFRDAAMALEKVGDVSEPVLSTSGVHIICYHSDVVPGAVELDSVRDALTEQVLSAKQDEAYQAQYDEWYAAANVKKYPKVLG